MRIKYGISMVSKVNIAKGEILKEEQIAFKIPGGGIMPKDMALYMGKKLKSDKHSD